MAVRLDVQVVRGEIDNRVRGRVRGRIWITGRDVPLTLDLAGDPWRDLAGCRLEFENPKPVVVPHTPAVATDQSGVVGDITASHRVRVPDVPLGEFYAGRRRGEEVPEHWANALSIEWFSQANGRVVIESTDFTLRPSLPEWQMTPEEERVQREKNARAMTGFLARLTEAIERGRERARNDDTDADAMDEFGWERVLRESDLVGQKYGELLDKYGVGPETEEIIAREMGWHHGLAEATPQQQEWLDAMAEAAAEAAAQAEVGLDDGGAAFSREDHPLVEEATTLAVDFWRWCKDHGLFEGDGDEDASEAAFQAQALGAKLAGALGGLRHGVDSRGFVVATLKRALPYLDAALSATQRLDARQPPPVPPERVQAFRAGLFAIREEMLRIMGQCRRE